MQLEIDILKMLGVGKILHTEQFLARCEMLDVINISGRTADHFLDQRVLCDLSNGQRIHIGAVLEDGDTVTDLHDLFQAV